jgi:YfiH family protein
MDTSVFEKRVEDGVPFYRCLPLEALGFLRHGFSTRQGGVSLLPEAALNLSRVRWDSPASVEENRRRFLGALGLSPRDLVTLRQVHSDRIHIISDSGASWNLPPEGDALVTDRAGVAVAVQVADCFPVLIADPGSRAVAAVHAGWRGILAGILAKTVRTMSEVFRCRPGELLLAIGPGIGACCMEVGADVQVPFERAYPSQRVSFPHPTRAGKFLLDLRIAMARQLVEAGVPVEHVYDLKACTRCLAGEFFSYRAEGPRSGRTMGVIAMSRA